jgi:hypothetical protein
MKQWISKLGILFVLSATACDDGSKIDIGDDEPVETLGSKLSDYSGTWTGYAEAYKFTDGTDKVQVVLDGTGSGSIKFGSVAWPAPDPKGPVPGPEDGGDEGFRSDRVEAGFPFTVQAADITDNRIRFSIKNMEAYKDYCAVHRASPLPAGSYTCATPLVGTPVAGPSDCSVGGMGPDAHAVECATISCGEVCTCTSAACSVAWEYSNVQPSVDAALTEDGRGMVGTFAFGDTRITVRLKHQ